MWDLHAVSSGGGTTLTDIGTILLGGDRATVAGVPVKSHARLVRWGGLTTIADTIFELRLLNNDMQNPRLGQYFQLGASSLLGAINVETDVVSGGQRLISMRQNTGAANNIGYTTDYYADVPGWTPNGDYSGAVIDSEAASAALVAITWGETAWAPTVTLESGQYAILGAWVNVATNYGLLRFTHNDFSGFLPGFAFADTSNPAVARAVDSRWSNFLPDGYQFVALGECPVFTATQEATGLGFQLAAITADTPRVHIHVKKLS